MTAVEQILAIIEKDTRRRRLHDSRERRQSIAILSREFGKRHGWIPSRSSFSLKQLADRSIRIDKSETGLMENMVMSRQPIFYREAKRPYRPAALVLQCESWAVSTDEIESVCDRYKLCFEFVLDFPCWVDDVELILLMPCELRKRNRRPEQITLPFGEFPCGS